MLIASWDEGFGGNMKWVLSGIILSLSFKILAAEPHTEQKKFNFSFSKVFDKNPAVTPKACVPYSRKDRLLPFKDYKGEEVGTDFHKNGPTIKVSVSGSPEDKEFTKNLLEECKNQITATKAFQYVGSLGDDSKVNTTPPQLVISIDITKQIAQGFELGWQTAYQEKETKRVQGVYEFKAQRPIIGAVFNRAVNRRSHTIAEQRFRAEAPSLVHKGVWDKVLQEMKEEGDKAMASLPKEIDPSRVKFQFKWEEDVERNFQKYLTSPETARYAGVILPNGHYHQYWHDPDIKASTIAKALVTAEKWNDSDDNDCDGLVDYKDLCSNTPTGKTVPMEGPRMGCGEGEEPDAPEKKIFGIIETGKYAELNTFPAMPNVARGEPYNYIVFPNNGNPLAYSIYPHDGKLSYHDTATQSYKPLERAQMLDLAKLVNSRISQGKHQSTPEATQAYIATFRAAAVGASSSEKNLLGEVSKRLEAYLDKRN